MIAGTPGLMAGRATLLLTVGSYCMRLSLVSSLGVLAILAVGCGGGGSSAPALPGVPLPAVTAPASTSAVLTPGIAGATATLAQIDTGYAGTITVPALAAGAGATLTATLQGTLPAGLVAPSQIARAPRGIGVALTPLVYETLVPSAAISFGSTPGLTFTLPTGTSLASGSSAYVALFDPAQSSTGWQSFAGPGTVSGQTITFAMVPGTLVLSGGTTYAFVLFSTAKPVSTGTPISPLANGTLKAQLTGAVPPAARSATFVLTSAGSSPYTITTSIPSGCASALPCSLTLQVPAGANVTTTVMTYGSTDGSGAALAGAHTVTTYLAGQTTTGAFPLAGIMASFNAVLNPNPLVIGSAGIVNAVVTALDAASESLAAPVDSNLNAVAFCVAVTSSPQSMLMGGFACGSAATTNLTLPLQYSGVSGSATVEVQSPGYTSVTVTPTFTSATPPPAVAYALASGGSVSVYAPNNTIPIQTFVLSGTGPIRYDVNGTLWSGTTGVQANGTPVSLPSGIVGTPLAFDTQGNAYTVVNTTPMTPGATSSSVINVYKITGRIALLTRFVNIAGGVVSLAVDPVGNLYAGGTFGVYEYGPGGGNGSISPIAQGTNTSGPVAVDRSGNLFAVFSGNVGIWPVGTFGLSAPATQISMASSNLPPNFALTVSDLAANSAGDIEIIGYNPYHNLGHIGWLLNYLAPGFTTCAPCAASPQGASAYYSVATPIR
ncbi:MAG: hypothetical protein NVSMB5_26520 [Candidatus Velthaea sp.]